MQKEIFKGLFYWLIIIIIISSCRQNTAENNESAHEMSKLTIEEVQKKYQNQLISIPGVIGVGITKINDEPAIKVLVVKKIPEVEQNIPKSLEGFQVVIEETGEIHAPPRKKDV